MAYARLTEALKSSAKSLMVEFMLSAMSLMYIKNNVGPRTVPWGTPEVTSAGSKVNLLLTPA